eukprot:scaffold321703_cov22-Tisochrysis_lutea.AAC.1
MKRGMDKSRNQQQGSEAWIHLTASKWHAIDSNKTKHGEIQEPWRICYTLICAHNLSITDLTNNRFGGQHSALRNFILHSQVTHSHTTYSSHRLQTPVTGHTYRQRQLERCQGKLADHVQQHAVERTSQ